LEKTTGWEKKEMKKIKKTEKKNTTAQIRD
jgi:hypothetical protein